MTFSLDTQLQSDPNVIVTELTDGDGKPQAVLLNIATQKYFSLNATGIRIWKILEQQLPLSAAVSDLTASYDVSKDRAEDSVLTLADALFEAELVTAVEMPT